MSINKIDIVYTWVDGTDEKWLNKRALFKKAKKRPFSLLRDPISNTSVASSSETELYYSIKSVKKFMPWVNNIYIVSDQQIPKQTLQENPDIIMVSHHDIFPSEDCLPNFNSCAIESCLTNIDGLSEHFIYMNDDFFINRPIKLNELYKDSKTAILQDKFLLFRLTPQFVYRSFLHRDVTTLKRVYCNKLLNKHYAKRKRFLLQHSPAFIIKTEFNKCKKLFATEFNSTISNRFRAPTDIVPFNFLYQYYLLEEDKAFINKKLTGKLLMVTNSSLINYFFQKLASKKLSFFCINEYRYKYNKKSIEQMRRFLDKRFA